MLPFFLQYLLTKRQKRSILDVELKMEFIREIRRVDKNVLTIKLPDAYKHKDVEILVLPFEERAKEAPLKCRTFESMKKISIDTRMYKFNRDELHER